MKLYRFFILSIFLLTLSSCGLGKEENIDKTQYLVDKDHFDIDRIYLNGNEYIINYECDTDIVKLGVIYSFYENNELVYSNTIYEDVNYEALTLATFKMSISMYSGIPEVELFGYSNSLVHNVVEKELENTSKYEVSFYNDSSLIDKKTVKHGKTVVRIDDPVKEGFNFVGWYTEKELINPFNFNNPITKNISLYAKFSRDYMYLTNKITKEIMPSCVTVSNMYNYGSGVIFDEDDGYYYVLTNNHVAPMDQSYAVYTNNPFISYEATYIRSDVSYDLAILRIKKYNNSLKVIELAQQNPCKNDLVISIGSPERQVNSITYGIITQYCQTTLSDKTSDVDFEVIKHSSYINNGSSGGVLLNDSLQAVGVNFAGSENEETGDFVYGLAVPIEKVLEFINLESYKG